MAKQRPAALVTGGAKRVGRAMVERLAQAGFDVAFTYFQSRADADELCKLVPGSVAIRANLVKSQTAAQAVATAVDKKLGRLDLLVNNASLYEEGDLQTIKLESFREMMAIHFETPLMLARHLEPLLRLNHGHIVNMLDILVERPRPQYMAYCASKAALWNLTQSLARQLAPEVTVNGIAPGVVEWPKDYPGEEREKYLQRVPLARAGQPRDVAELVLFLATTGKYITGQVIRLDGGRSLM